MSASTTPVASETLAYCTSCKMDLNHRIVAMKGDRIAKVQCLTCKKEHVYRAPKGVSEPEKAPKGKKSSQDAAAAAATAIQLEWEKLMAQTKNVPVKAYSSKAKFHLGDKIRHPSFGEGIVGKLIYPNKMEVIFQMDLKVMIHGGA